MLRDRKMKFRVHLLNVFDGRRHRSPAARPVISPLFVQRVTMAHTP